MKLCRYCERPLPNESFRTKKRCIWCDIDYHYKKNERGYSRVIGRVIEY